MSDTGGNEAGAEPTEGDGVVAAAERPAGSDGRPEEAPAALGAEEPATEPPATGEPAPAEGPAEGAAGDTPAPTPPPVFRVMDVMDVRLDLPSQYPLVSLQEAEPPLRHLVFPIGLPEATGLSYALRKIATPRPLSHELFASVLAHFQIDVVAVRLVGRRAGTYLAEIDLIGAKGREVISCRPSDGLALALRMPVGAPILCDERLLVDSDGDVEPG